MSAKFLGDNYGTEQQQQEVLKYLYLRAEGATGLNTELASSIGIPVFNRLSTLGLAAVVNELQKLFLVGRNKGVADLEPRIKSLGIGLLGALTELLAISDGTSTRLYLRVDTNKSGEDEISEIAALAMASQGLCPSGVKDSLKTLYQNASTINKRLAIATILLNQFDEIAEFEKEIVLHIISKQGLDDVYNRAISSNRGESENAVKVVVLKSFMIQPAIEFVLWDIAKSAR